MADGRYSVMRSDEADARLKELLLDYASTVSTRTALKLAREFERGFSRLSHFPYSGRLTDACQLKARGYRKLVIGKYLVVYLVFEELRQVIVTGIYNQRENLEGLV